MSVLENLSEFDRHLIQLWTAGLFPSEICSILAITPKAFAFEIDRLAQANLVTRYSNTKKVGRTTKAIRKDIAKDALFYTNNNVDLNTVAALLGCDEELITESIAEFNEAIEKEPKLTKKELKAQKLERNAQIVSEYVANVNVVGIISLLAEKYSVSRKTICNVLDEAEVRQSHDRTTRLTRIQQGTSISDVTITPVETKEDVKPADTVEPVNTIQEDKQEDLSNQDNIWEDEGNIEFTPTNKVHNDDFVIEHNNENVLDAVAVYDNDMDELDDTENADIIAACQNDTLLDLITVTDINEYLFDSIVDMDSPFIYEANIYKIIEIADNIALLSNETTKTERMISADDESDKESNVILAKANESFVINSGSYRVMAIYDEIAVIQRPDGTFGNVYKDSNLGVLIDWNSNN